MIKSTMPQGNLREMMFQAIFPGACQSVAFTGTSGQSAALQTKTSLVRLFATKDCFIKIATNPTALADGTSMFIAGGIYEYIGVDNSVNAQKIAVISNGTNGTLYITEAS
jgi:hypothetical protein